MTIAPVPDTRATFVKWLVRGLLVYWFLYAAVAPVTIYDSHVYNISRLLVIQKGGFFGNHAWNVFAQICYPWGFDAVHYPFLFIGAGFDLPSFACFLGLLVVIHHRVSLRYGPAMAWWCDLAVLAMPTIIYQATSTKNDMAGVFGVAVWYHALCLWTEKRQRAFLFWMALALAFTAGTKLSGPPVAFVLTLYTLWKLRAGPWRLPLVFLGALSVCFLCFGSAETYLNNYLLFKSPLGPPEPINFHRNIDGVAGGVANSVRYSFGVMNVGIDACNLQSPVPGWLENACRGTLHFMGLDNVGYRRDYNDARFSVLKTGLEAASDFGPVGALALLTAVYLSVARRPGDPLWKLVVAGLLSLAQICLTVGWMPWNNRFLLLPFCLFGVAFTLFSLRDGPRLWLRQTLLLLLLIFSAVAYPLHSFNKKPSDLLHALTHRAELTVSERPAMGEVVNDLTARLRAGQMPPLLLTAGVDSWTYDILRIKNLNVLPTPTLNKATLAAAQARTGAGRLLVLLLNRPLDPALATELTPVNIYAEADTALYEWRAADVQNQSPDSPPVLRFTDGWYAEESTGSEHFRWMSSEGHLSILCGRSGRVRISARVRSFVPDNALDFLVDGQVMANQPADDMDWHESSWLAPLTSGVHHCEFRSHQPGKQPPNDDRTLTFCVENLQVQFEP